ncbi:MAG: hypothetical protein GY760_12120 [Deltaproteobacteria bacterium]|nr:hypothetical protein [Deltaproteobacteria bacterium]
MGRKFGVDDPPSDRIPVRSLEYTEAIKKAVNGELDVRTNKEMREGK